jgi:hypothetical protein
MEGLLIVSEMGALVNVKVISTDAFVEESCPKMHFIGVIPTIAPYQCHLPFWWFGIFSALYV